MSFQEIFRQFSAEQGWTPEKEAEVLLDIADELVNNGSVSTEDLETLLREHAADAPAAT